MRDIYFVPQFIPCPQCSMRHYLHDLYDVINTTKDREFICECGRSITLGYIGKYCAMVKNVKDEG